MHVVYIQIQQMHLLTRHIQIQQMHLSTRLHRSEQCRNFEIVGRSLATRWCSKPWREPTPKHRSETLGATDSIHMCARVSTTCRLHKTRWAKAMHTNSIYCNGTQIDKLRWCKTGRKMERQWERTREAATKQGACGDCIYACTYMCICKHVHMYVRRIVVISLAKINKPWIMHNHCQILLFAEYYYRILQSNITICWILLFVEYYYLLNITIEYYYLLNITNIQGLRILLCWSNINIM